MKIIKEIVDRKEIVNPYTLPQFTKFRIGHFNYKKQTFRSEYKDKVYYRSRVTRYRFI